MTDDDAKTKRRREAGEVRHVLALGTKWHVALQYGQHGMQNITILIAKDTGESMGQLRFCYTSINHQVQLHMPSASLTSSMHAANT